MSAAQQALVSYFGGLVASYATWNPADKGTSVTLSNGNLTWTNSGGANAGVRSTISKTSGKYYWETTITAGVATNIGIALSTASISTFAGTTGQWLYDQNGGSGAGAKHINGTASAYGTAFTTGDVIGCAFDVGTGSLEFYKNNVSQGVAVTGLGAGTYFAFTGSGNLNETTTTNFGASAFTYTPPGGYFKGLGNNLPMQPIYATWDPVNQGGGGGITLSNGNLTQTVGGGAATRAGFSTIGKSSGKWYWEITPGSTAQLSTGICLATVSQSQYIGANASGWGYVNSTGAFWTNGATGSSGATFTSADVIGVALDMGAGTLALYKNNVLQGTPFTGLTGTVFAANSNYSSGTGCVVTANFGATALTYTPPTGFNAGLYN